MGYSRQPYIIIQISGNFGLKRKMSFLGDYNKKGELVPGRVSSILEGGFLWEGRGEGGGGSIIRYGAFFRKGRLIQT